MAKLRPREVKNLPFVTMVLSCEVWLETRKKRKNKNRKKIIMSSSKINKIDKYLNILIMRKNKDKITNE